MAQIVVHIQVVVMECTVLFRIKYLQQSSSRITFKVARHLVDLIQYKYRIGSSCFLYILKDSSAHSTNICPAMTSDFCLVVQTSQGNTYILPAQCFCNRAAQRSLSDSRRTIQADDRRLHIFLQLQYSQMFDNTFLYLLQTIMIPIQYPTGMIQVKIVCRIGFPWQTDNGLYILHLHRIIRRLRMQALQLMKFFVENLGNGLRPYLISCFVLQLLYIPIIHAATQLFLDRLDLLLQEIFLLLLINIFLRFHLDRSLQFDQLKLPVQ